jgi:hypothetical protein
MNGLVKWIRGPSIERFSYVQGCEAPRSSVVNGLKSYILTISWHLIIIRKKKHFLEEWVFNIFSLLTFFVAPCSHCYQSTLVTVTFIGHMFSLSQSEISFYFMTDWWNHPSCRKCRFFAVFDLIIFYQQTYTFYKTHRVKKRKSATKTEKKITTTIRSRPWRPLWL